jgi:hypothetical protein
MSGMAEWQEWQSGVQVEKCDKVNYPHYCVDANNATKTRKAKCNGTRKARCNETRCGV